MGSGTQTERMELLQDLTTPVGLTGSGGLRYGAAMQLYVLGEMSPEMLEIFRICNKFDNEDPISVARHLDVPLPLVCVELERVNHAG